MKNIFCFFFGMILMLTSSAWADLTHQEYKSPPSTFYRYLDFKDISEFNRDDKTCEGQSEEWQRQMQRLGQDFSRAKVRSVYFVHGTFAGDDPVGIVTLIKAIYPDLSPTVEDSLRDLLKKKSDTLLADSGNYLPEYISLFEKAIGGQIPCRAFNWSSANHHIARLQATVRLARSLAETIDQEKINKEERILLVGHSHAGQLFALLTNFLANSEGVEELLQIAQDSGENVDDMKENLSKLANVQLDIATFGTPPRYGWGKGDYRLLNVINHRGPGYLGGDILGLLNTEDGDYVQQWGIAGTDILASTSLERDLNKSLDKILGPGRDRLFWLNNVKVKMRVPHYGNTLLVNYKDSSSFFPNVLSTFFGHGTYTKYEALLFNTDLIVEELYR